MLCFTRELHPRFEMAEVVVEEIIEENVQEVEHPNQNITDETSFSKKNVVKILILGEVGSGKSTLINAMLRETLARTSYGPKVTQTCLEQLEVHKGKYEGTNVKVFESLGFLHPDIDDKTIIKNITKLYPISTFDILIICHRMNTRADDRVKQMLSILGKMVNNELWSHSIVVLTFANFFLQQKEIKELTEEGQREVMLRHVVASKETFKEFTKKKVKERTFKDIPFVVAGAVDELKLPTTLNWVADVWTACIHQCKAVDTAKPSKKSFFRSHRKTKVGKYTTVSVSLAESINDDPTSEQIHEYNASTNNTEQVVNEDNEVANIPCVVDLIPDVHIGESQRESEDLEFESLKLKLEQFSSSLLPEDLKLTQCSNN